MHFYITSTDYDNAYNTAVERIKNEWKNAFDDCGGFDEWAGDVLGDFLDEFLNTLGIQEINEND